MNPTERKFTSISLYRLVVAFVLLAAPLNSGAATTVIHTNLNGPFASSFSCDVNNVCGSVFVGAQSTGNTSTQWFLYYNLFLPNGDQYFGGGSIPASSVTVAPGLRGLTLAADTSVLAATGFYNAYCAADGNCYPASGGVISGTWQKVNVFSSRSTVVNTSHFGHLVSTFNGTFDDFSAVATFSVLGNNFSGASGDIGTQSNSGITLQRQ